MNVNNRNIAIYSLIFLSFIIPITVRDSPFYLDLIIRIAQFAFLVAAWNIPAGYTGLISFNHVALYGIGAYISTLLQLLLGMNAWVSIGLASLLTPLIAIAFIFPAVRLKGLFLSLATIAFAVAVQVIFLNLSIVTYEGEYPRIIGGGSGVFVPMKGESFIDFQWHYSKIPYVYIILIFLLLEILFTYKLTKSRIGYYFVATKDDDLAAEHLGINTIKYKLLSIGIAGFLSAIAGGFAAQYLLFVEPNSFLNINLMFTVALLAILGGLGTVNGPLLSSIIYVPLSTILRISLGGTQYSSLALVILGIVLVAIAIPLPSGLYGLLRRLYEKHVRNSV